MCVYHKIYIQSSDFSLSKNWLKFQEKLFSRGVKCPIRNLTVYLKTLQTCPKCTCSHIQRNIKCYQKETFGDLVTNSLKLFYHIYHIQGHFNCQKAFSIYYYYPVDATERLAPLCSSGATSLAVGKSSCASLV